MVFVDFFRTRRQFYIRKHIVAIDNSFNNNCLCINSSFDSLFSDRNPTFGTGGCRGSEFGY
jgi:hypothetical protein